MQLWFRVAAVLVAAFVLVGCSPQAGGGSPTGQPGGVRLSGVVTAGPTCPVVTQPPQPGCDDRSVAGAVLLVRDQAGHQVAQVTSAADGSFAVDLPAGSYRLVPQAVDGLMGTAAEQDFTLAERAVTLTVTYDTGIR